MEFPNLRTDSAFNFSSILYLRKYLRGHKGYIAGGCFKNIFKEEDVKDVDVFFRTEEDFKEADNLFRNSKNYKEIYENDNAVGYYDADNEVEIDLVKSEFSSPEQMISRFDFTITKFALFLNDMGEGEKTWSVAYHEDFFQHLMLNRVVIDGDLIDFPLNTFDRVLRYASYGYQPCTGTKAKLIRQINAATLPENDEELFIGFYHGID